MDRKYWGFVFFLDDNENTYGSRPDLTRINDIPIPDWVQLGESVSIRPYNWQGVIAYIGVTAFAPGTWVGVALDAPTGMD